MCRWPGPSHRIFATPFASVYPYDAAKVEGRGRARDGVDEAIRWLTGRDAPTSTSAREATFRPEVVIDDRPTRVLAEQTSAVDPQRLGESAGHLSVDELRRVDAALRLVLGR